MDLPVMPPVRPMLAKSVKGIPDPAKHTVDGIEGLSFEPKWDGFRCLVFKDGDEVELASRNTKPLTRYFPEVVAAMREQLPDAVRARRRDLRGAEGDDGVDRLEFEVLQERIHPAKSRGSTCSPRRRRPAFVAFDLLALGDTSYVDRPFAERRAALEQALGRPRRPVLPDPDDDRPGRGRGVVPPVRGRRARRRGRQAAGRAVRRERPHHAQDQARAHRRRRRRRLPRAQDQHARAAAARQPAARPVRPDGELQHIGVSASFTEARRAELIEQLQPLVVPIEEHPWGRWAEFLTANPDRVPGTQSRWSQGKDLSFTPLRPDLVIEVAYDHMEGRRFRHTAQFRRWRTDRDPESCGYDQLDEPVSYDLTDVLGRPEGLGFRRHDHRPGELT